MPRPRARQPHDLARAEARERVGFERHGVPVPRGAGEVVGLRHPRVHVRERDVEDVPVVRPHARDDALERRLGGRRAARGPAEAQGPEEARRGSEARRPRARSRCAHRAGSAGASLAEPREATRERVRGGERAARGAQPASGAAARERPAWRMLLRFIAAELSRARPAHVEQTSEMAYIPATIRKSSW